MTTCILARAKIYSLNPNSSLQGAKDIMEMNPNNPQSLSVKQKIDLLVEEIMEIDPVTAERLVDIGNSLDDGEFWLNLELNNVINYPLFITRATSFFHKKSVKRKVIEISELVRNVLVLVPILLTWNALSRASAAYKVVVENNPSLLGRPFLLLWQEGFQGARVMSFSTVAFLDALVIMVVLCLTFAVLSLNSSALENAEQKAVNLGNRLQNLLWQIAKEAKPIQARQVSKLETRSLILIANMEKVILSFETHNKDLEGLLRNQRAEVESLAAQRNKEILSLQGFIKVFEQAVSNLTAFSSQFLGILEDIKNANRSSMEGLTKLAELSAQLQRLEHQILQLSTAITQWGQNQQKSVQELTVATGNAVGKAETIASSIPDMASAVKTLTKAQNELVNFFSVQKDETRTWINELQGAIQEIKRISEQIATTMQGLNGVTQIVRTSLEQTNLNSEQIKTLGEKISTTFTALQSGVQHLEENLVAVGKLFSLTIEPTKALSTGLPGITGKLNLLDAINNDLVGLQKSMREMSDLLGQTSDTMERTYYSNLDYAKILEREITNLRAVLQRNL